VSGAAPEFAGVLTRLASALALTIAIEVPVAALLGLRTRRAVAAVALVSVVTNPPLNFALLALGLALPGFAENAAAYWLTVAALELLAVLAEWRLLLWVLGGESRRMLVVSAVMNAASFGAGLVWLAFASRGPALG
jgi:hypothetical protein